MFDFVSNFSLNTSTTQLRKFFPRHENLPGFCRFLVKSVASLADQTVLLAGVLVAFSIIFASSAHAEIMLLSKLIDSVMASDNCVETVDSKTRGEGCLRVSGSTISLLPESMLKTADSRNESAYGIKFGIPNNKVFSYDHGLGDRIDTVVPIVLTQPRSNGLVEESNSGIFLRQGITSWRDDANQPRDDLRTSVILSFRPFETTQDEVGISLTYEKNQQAGHRMLISSLGFETHWGGGSLRRYSPLTEWLDVGSGMEEKSLEGFEMGWRMNLSNTVSAGIIGYRWLEFDASDETQWTQGIRTNLEWRPGRFVTTRLGHDRNGEDDEGQLSAFVGVTIPLGGGSRASSRWQVMEAYPKRTVRREIEQTEEVSN